MAKKKKKAGIVAHQLPSGNYRVRLFVGKDANGKRISKSFTSSDPDEAIQAAMLYKQTADEPKTESVTIAQAVERYIESKENVLSPASVEGYKTIERNRLDDIKDIDIKDFTSAVAQKYVNGLAKQLSPKTVANTWGLIISAIHMQQPDKRIIVTLPAKKKIVRDLPTAPEVIKAIRGKDIELPALLALWLSLRMSEVRGIKYKDITRNVLTIRRTVLTVKGQDILREQTKTYGSTRRIRLPPYLQNLIGSGAPDDFVVKQSAEVIYRHFVAAVEESGLPHMRFHDLRHLSASVMVMLGVPDKYSMERGGWTTNSTLQNVYQHTFSAERSAVDDKVDTYYESILG